MIIAEGKTRKFFLGKGRDTVKVYFTHSLKCFLTMEVNVSAMELHMYKSSENTMVFSSHALRPSLHFLTRALQTVPTLKATFNIH